MKLPHYKDFKYLPNERKRKLLILFRNTYTQKEIATAWGVSFQTVNLQSSKLKLPKAPTHGKKNQNREIEVYERGHVPDLSFLDEIEDPINTTLLDVNEMMNKKASERPQWGYTAPVEDETHSDEQEYDGFHTSSESNHTPVEAYLIDEKLPEIIQTELHRKIEQVVDEEQDDGLQCRINGEFTSDKLIKRLTKLALMFSEEDGSFEVKIHIKEK